MKYRLILKFEVRGFWGIRDPTKIRPNQLQLQNGAPCWATDEAFAQACP